MTGKQLKAQGEITDEEGLSDVEIDETSEGYQIYQASLLYWLSW